jgi:hypothetical protein
VSGHILHLSISHSHVFLLNSRLGHFSATCCIATARHPFSRSYRVNLPSSLAMDHSSTLGSSPRLPVSVSGTGTISICLGGFLGSLLTFSITLAEASVYYWVSAKPADLPTSPIPTPFNAHIRPGAELSLLRHPIARYGSMGILTHWPSRSPLGLRLGPDLPAVD